MPKGTFLATIGLRFDNFCSEGEYLHRARTVRAPYLTKFARKWSTGRGVLDGTWWALKRYHFPLVGFGWLLYFLVGLGWLPVFLDGLRMVADSSWGPGPLFLVGCAWLLFFCVCSVLLVWKSVTVATGEGPLGRAHM